MRADTGSASSFVANAFGLLSMERAGFFNAPASISASDLSRGRYAGPVLDDHQLRGAPIRRHTPRADHLTANAPQEWSRNGNSPEKGRDEDRLYLSTSVTFVNIWAKNLQYSELSNEHRRA